MAVDDKKKFVCGETCGESYIYKLCESVISYGENPSDGSFSVCGDKCGESCI